MSRVGGQFETALGWSRRPASLSTRAALCGLALVVFAAPLVVVLSGAFDADADAGHLRLWPRRPTLLNFTVAGERGVWGYLAHSLLIVGLGLALQLAVSVCAAYSLAFHRFRGRAAVLLLFLLTMMLPEAVLAIPLSVVIGDLPVLHVSLKGTVFGVVLPVGLWGFAILVMTEFFKEVPAEIIDAARIDGVGELRLLWNIVLPLSRSAVGVLTIFGYLMIWNQYLLPLLVANDQSDYTLTVALAVLRDDSRVGPGVTLAGSLLALVPSLVVYLLLQRSLVRGITAGATKG
jgi:multiple sugar transport system permease protein